MGQNTNDCDLQRYSNGSKWAGDFDRAVALIRSKRLNAHPYRGAVRRVASQLGYASRESGAAQLQRGNPRFIAALAAEIVRIDRMVAVELRYAMEDDQ